VSSIPTFDVHDLDPRALGVAFREYGFVSIHGHAIDASLVGPAYAAVARFFALPEAQKQRYHLEGAAGARGYTPFRTEKAKDQTAPDLKEFWHVGRELEPSDPLFPRMQPNVWPREVPELKAALLPLYRALDALGAEILSALAIDLGLPPAWFADKVDHGNSILRPLHYPPLQSARSVDVVDGVRSAAHEDINLITLMVAAAEPGLEILRRDGSYLAVDVPEGEVVVNIGDMLQRLTNHVLPSTTHRVINPAGDEGARSRYSLPFFLHPNSEFVIETLPSCCDEARPNRYPQAITADAYLTERLRQIGLLSPGAGENETAGCGP
jgi:isopenicillin N synthase-like dioxygenase